jgi:protein-tyrosine kinase
MSRIEEALEKAAQMRQTVKEPASPPIATTVADPTSSPVFKISEPLVDLQRVNKCLVCLKNPGSPAAEQYKKLRAQVIKATKKDFLNSILITSAQAGEGKSCTAINLAITIAQEIDHTVLLVDSDLRQPSIHSYLGIQADIGLSDYLLGKAELADILIHTGIGKLVLLPAGRPPANAAELLSSNRMKELVKEMKFRYKDRYIIFDSSPALLASDTLALCEYADGILLVVHAARTSERFVKKAVNLIKSTPILGIVYNNVPDYMSKDKFTYNYYGKYSETV